MTFVADYSWARPDPVKLRQAGYTGVSRYVSTDPSKNITVAEFQALRAAGLTVVLNWESTATRALAGQAAGSQDAVAAEQQADTVGYALDAPIYYSVDTQATVDQIRPYFQGVHSAAHRPVGFYGGQPAGLQLATEQLVTYLWVSNAASWSGYQNWSALRQNVAPQAHMIQHVDTPFGFAGQIDHNEVLRPDWAGGSEVLDPNDAIVQELRAGAAYAKDTYNVNRGLSKTPSFLDDIHKTVAALTANEGADSAKLDALGKALSAISATADPHVPSPDAQAVRDAVAAVLQSVHA